MNPNEQNAVNTVRAIALEAESHLAASLGTFDRLRAAISVLEEENRHLRLEMASRKTEFFTEKEFAERLKISVRSLASERRAGRLQPKALQFPDESYTDEEFCRIFKINRSTAAHWRKQKTVSYCKLPNGQIRYKREHVQKLWNDTERQASEAAA